MNYKYDPNHPIQLSDEQFYEIAQKTFFGKDRAVAAAQLGADMQLANCCQWLCSINMVTLADTMMAAMRPRPLSKREQALKILSSTIGKPEALHLMGDDIVLIREALMEGQGDD